jgi:centractin
MSGDYTDVLTNQPVVIDNVSILRTLNQVLELICGDSKGSGTIKAGFAGQEHPKCYFPSLYASFSSVTCV